MLRHKLALVKPPLVLSHVIVIRGRAAFVFVLQQRDVPMLVELEF